MEKYTGHKKSYVTNFFSNCKKLEHDKERLEKQYVYAKEKLLLMEKNGSSPEALSDMKDKTSEIRLNLAKANRQCKKKNRVIARLVVSLGLATTILTSTTASMIHNQKAESEFHNNFSEGYSYTQENDNTNSSKISYLNFKDDLKTYVILSNKENLSHNEKEELKNAKARIQASPEEITQFALEVLKTKIAKSLNIDDFNRITILDSSTQVNTDAYHSEKGFIEDISISIDDKTKFSFKTFESLMSGEKRTESNTIPKEVLNAINQIVASQRDSQNLKLAYKSLETCLQLETKDLSFEQLEETR